MIKNKYLINRTIRCTIFDYPDGGLVSIAGQMDWIHETYEAAKVALMKYVKENDFLIIEVAI